MLGSQDIEQPDLRACWRIRLVLLLNDLSTSTSVGLCPACNGQPIWRLDGLELATNKVKHPMCGDLARLQRRVGQGSEPIYDFVIDEVAVGCKKTSSA